jgi:hypothetical protein
MGTFLYKHRVFSLCAIADLHQKRKNDTILLKNKYLCYRNEKILKRAIFRFDWNKNNKYE